MITSKNLNIRRNPIFAPTHENNQWFYWMHERNEYPSNQQNRKTQVVSNFNGQLSPYINKNGMNYLNQIPQRMLFQTPVSMINKEFKSLSENKVIKDTSGFKLKEFRIKHKSIPRTPLQSIGSLRKEQLIMPKNYGVKSNNHFAHNIQTYSKSSDHHDLVGKLKELIYLLENPS